MRSKVQSGGEWRVIVVFKAKWHQVQSYCFFSKLYWTAAHWTPSSHSWAADFVIQISCPNRFSVVHLTIISTACITSSIAGCWEQPTVLSWVSLHRPSKFCPLLSCFSFRSFPWCELCPVWSLEPAHFGIHTEGFLIGKCGVSLNRWKSPPFSPKNPKRFQLKRSRVSQRSRFK